MRAENVNTAVHVAGLALMVVGVGLAYWGYQLSGSLTSQLTKTVSGMFPDEVMYRYVGGSVCWLAGIFMLYRK